MVEQVESGREIRCAPALPFKLRKIQTAEVGSITPAVTCLAGGYHSVVHQLVSVGRRIVHGGGLEMVCHHCGGRAPYRVNVYLLDALYYGAC